MKLNKDAIGSSFDDFLEEENILAESDAIAIKRVVAFEVAKSMREKHITKTEMAKRMGTSRSSLTRLLDPLNNSITLATIETALAAIGKRVQIQIV
ncbi:helix-turn-helix domain-containing protein (plasmid) [Sulfurimonas aquatica]|uniref:Helix-turn-helix domain-containing protein n=1 Tax=Sulfurimonas aquatica TaxID=2672570 RepID=A0A975B2X6_9BACT|nr:XRE family transcriptional regulator [Sulfurimonas aquatica]QSZ43198.1 helix-turn-helix domain-containing protein [Sulfurimonas aquatica]